MTPATIVTLFDVQQAAERIRPYVHRTPIHTSSALDRMFGAQLVFKCENLQKIGAFKARGAVNAVLQLDQATAKRGVATHSSGNHAQALAYAAGLRNIPCTIVMPTSAPAVKRSAVLGYGATIVDCAPTLAAREATLAQVVEQTGAHVVPPYNDIRVIAGQGTAALELLEEVSDLDIVMAPVGGGGLMSGTAVACRGMQPNIDVIGAEPSVADDAARSLRDGVIHPAPTTQTIADGLRTSLGDVTFAHLRHHSVDIRTASEESIVEALYLVMERMKLVIEPSAAVTLAVLLEQPELVKGKKVGIILCGGNLDVRTLMHRVTVGF